jgi:DNA-binding XRE family transcriptional regulator
MNDEKSEGLDAVGSRLRKLRHEREITLAELSAATGISVSTLSRLESGSRRPTWPEPTASRSTSWSTPQPPVTRVSTYAPSTAREGRRSCH